MCNYNGCYDNDNDYECGCGNNNYTNSYYNDPCRRNRNQCVGSNYYDDCCRCADSIFNSNSNNTSGSRCCNLRPRDCIRYLDPTRLPIRMCLCYRGLAFDGCFFYVTLPEMRKVSVFDRRLRMRAMFDIDQKFENLTYDPNENVFWATVDGDNKHIYKLNRRLQIIAKVALTIKDTECHVICSLSFNCEKNKLVVVIAGNILEVNKDGTLHCKVASSCCCQQICSVLCIAPYYVAIISAYGKQYIKVFSLKSCCDTCIQRVPDGFVLSDLVYVNTGCCDRICIYALASRNGSCNYLVKFVLNGICINNCNRPCPGRATNNNQNYNMNENMNYDMQSTMSFQTPNFNEGFENGTGHTNEKDIFLDGPDALNDPTCPYTD